MRRSHRRLSGGNYGVAVLAVLVAALPTMIFPVAVSAADTAMANIGTETQQAKWLEGLRLVSRGRFDEGAARIHEIVREGIEDARVRRVDHWLTTFEKHQPERDELVQADYEEYVAWVKEDIEYFRKDGKRGWWWQSIRDCARAFSVAEDQEAFRKESWLLATVSEAVEIAEEFEREQKWLNAARIYSPLTEIFPFNKAYRQTLERCQSRIRLQLVYAEDSEWEEAVKGITPTMASAAFRRIKTDYLKDPNFRAAAIAGLKQLLLMAKEPKLADVFEKLEDADAVNEFCARVGAKLEQAEEADEIEAEDLIKNFERVRIINNDTELFPEPVVVHEFVLGALRPLDRFSDMLWPVDIADFNKQTQGKFSGVGIQIRKLHNEPIRVISPLSGTPAFRAGIQPGDLITEINGQSAMKFSIFKAVAEITGPVGTCVKLTIRRPSENREFVVTLERQEITIHTVKGHERDAIGQWQYMIDPESKIGYVRLTHFTEGTTDELREVIYRLVKHEKLRGLIFDLRSNPGGTLKAAVDVSDLFLAENKRIVSTKDRKGKPWAKSSSRQERYTDFPMIILANEASASASEIVAGALQVHGRALILGERTFGKGSVQQVLLLNPREEACLKLTTALYYLPDGRCLHRDEDSTTWGVDPDIKLKLVPKEYRKMRDLQFKKEILKGKHQKQLTEKDLEALTQLQPSTEPADMDDDAAEKVTMEVPQDKEEEDEDAPSTLDRKDPNEFPEIDPQLQAALLLLRIQLATGDHWPTRSGALAAAGSDANKG